MVLSLSCWKTCFCVFSLFCSCFLSKLVFRGEIFFCCFLFCSIFQSRVEEIVCFSTRLATRYSLCTTRIKFFLIYIYGLELLVVVIIKIYKKYLLKKWTKIFALFKLAESRVLCRIIKSLKMNKKPTALRFPGPKSGQL